MITSIEAIVTKLRERDKHSPLTPQEGALLRLLCRGCINKTAAHQLGISERTIEIYRGRIMEKLGAKSPVHLGAIAVTRGLV